MMRQVEMRLYGTLARGSQTVGVPIFPKGSPFSQENGDPGSPSSWGSPKFYDTGNSGLGWYVMWTRFPNNGNVPTQYAANTASDRTVKFA